MLQAGKQYVVAMYSMESSSISESAKTPTLKFLISVHTHSFAHRPDLQIQADKQIDYYETVAPHDPY
jgi:hypothetical protein